MKHFTKYTLPCLVLSLTCLLTACEGQKTPASSSPAPEESVITPASPPPSQEVFSPDPKQSPTPAPVSISYLSVTSTTPSGLDGTVSEAAELPANVLQSLVLSNCEVYLYFQPVEQNGTTVSAVYAQIRAAGQQYAWQLSNRFLSDGYELLPLEGLFGFDAFAIKRGPFYYYYRAWDGTDDHYPDLLFYRECKPSLWDVDSDGQQELIITQGTNNEYTLALFSVGGDVYRLAFQSDRPVEDWTGLLADDTFLQTLKAAEAASITDYVQLAPPEGYTLAASSYTALRLLAEGGSDPVGSIFRRSAPHHDPSIEQGQIYFEGGQIVRFDAVDDHTSYQNFVPIDDCAAPAALAHSTYAPPYEAEPSSTTWVICFAREEGYMAFHLTLDDELFTKEDAIEIARSVQFTGNAFLVP